LISLKESALGWEPVAEPAIVVDHLVKCFGDVEAVKGVSFEVPEGRVLGLLGPNGAGKTTLVKILSTVLLPTGGQALVCGHDVVRETKAVRPLIGIVFGGERGLYTRLTALQNLEYWGALYRLSRGEIRSRSHRLLERVGLAERRARWSCSPRPGST